MNISFISLLNIYIKLKEKIFIKNKNNIKRKFKIIIRLFFIIKKNIARFIFFKN